jgi:hypothetical protein
MKPAITPIASSGPRWAFNRVRRSSASACSASTSKAKMRPLAQPQISGGNTRPNRGSSHSGSVTAITRTASSVIHSDQAVVCQPAAPWRACRVGNRRRATMPTIDGVISNATISSESITTRGTDTITITSGAISARRPPKPALSSQRNTASPSVQYDSALCTASTADAQYSQPRPSTRPPATSTGASDSRITRGCRQ